MPLFWVWNLTILFSLLLLMEGELVIFAASFEERKNNNDRYNDELQGKRH